MGSYKPRPPRPAREGAGKASPLRGLVWRVGCATTLHTPGSCSHCSRCELCLPLPTPPAIVQCTTFVAWGSMPGPWFLLGEAFHRPNFQELGELARSQRHLPIHRRHAVPSYQIPCSPIFHFSHRVRKGELRNEQEEWIFGA